MRFCVDYHWLNSITRKDTYPLPRVDDSLDLKWARRLVHNHNCIFAHTQVYMNSQLRHLDCVMPWQPFKG